MSIEDHIVCISVVFYPFLSKNMTHCLSSVVAKVHVGTIDSKVDINGKFYALDHDV